MNINKLKFLKFLNASGSRCALNNEGMCKLKNITSLNISDNIKITKISHLVSLKALKTNNRVEDNEIKNLTALTYLNITNGKINKVSHLTKLLALKIFSVVIDNNEIHNLTLLQELDIGRHKNTLWPKIDNSGISNLINIRHFCMHNNITITNVNHMLKLRFLDISGTCNIDNDNLNMLTTLISLKIYDNVKIFNINGLTKLRFLDASGKCDLCDVGISNLTNLRTLDIHNNYKITTILPFMYLSVLKCREDQIYVKPEKIINKRKMIWWCCYYLKNYRP